MLVIEGSDCLGKTTFAKEVVRYTLNHSEFPAFYSWMTRPNESIFDFHYDYKTIINPFLVQDRFHLGALAYHKNKLSQENRRRIESWISDCGGMIVVFYASDFEWYERLIKADKRGNILDWSILCEANKIFTEIARHQTRFDPPFFAFDISYGYLDNNEVIRVSEAWMNYRYHVCKSLMGSIKKEK